MKTLRLVHRWVGILVALPILLVAVSGGLLVFRDAYYRARWPILAQPAAESEWQRQPRILEAIDVRFAAEGVRTVKFPREGVNAFHVYLANEEEAFVDPRSGAVITQWDWHTDPAAFVFELHVHLLMGARGKLLNGYAALVLVLLSLSGALLWWPRRTGAFRLRHAVPSNASSAAVLRSHAASGVLLAASVLLFAVTGAGIVFYEPVSRSAAALLDASPPVKPNASVEPSAAPRATWSEILASARTALPEAGPAMYTAGSAKNAVLTFRKSLPGEWHPNGRSYVLVNPYTAEVVQTIDARAQGAGTRMMHALYPLHAAKIGGVALGALAVVTGIGLAWLALGGAWSYLGRALKGRASRRETAASPAFPFIADEGSRGRSAANHTAAQT